MFELLIAGLAVGTIWFWVFVVVVNLLIIVSLHNKFHWLLTTTVILAVVVFVFVSKIFPENWTVVQMLKWGAISAAVYFVVGIVYGTGRWWWLVQRQRGNYDDLQRQFLENVHATVFDPTVHAKEWNTYLKRHCGGEDSTYPSSRIALVEITTDKIGWIVSAGPRVFRHKADAVDWIAFWPWSALEWALWDLLSEIATKLYRMVSGWWQDIANSIFKDTKKDFESHEENA